MFSKRSPATSPRHLSPLPASGTASRDRSPARSRTNSLVTATSYGYSAPPPRAVQSDEALKTAKVLEGVLGAWNEYRLAVNQEGRARRRLAGLMKDLSGRMEREGVGYKAVKPAYLTIDALSDLTIAHSKRLETTYDQVNTEASRYFQNLARQVREHEAYLANEGKRAEKSEKAYRKASKVMTDGAIQGSGLEGMKDALKLEVDGAVEYHANLLGDAQTAILSKVASGLAGVISPSVGYHSEGLKISVERLGEVEYFRALAAAQWRDLALPESYQATAPTISSQDTQTSTRPITIPTPSEKSQQSQQDLRLPPAPVRPRLSPAYASSQSSLAPEIRSRNSLPPPPMYASSMSVPRASSLMYPSSASTLSPSPNPSPHLPYAQPRRRVSEIAASLESLAKAATPSPAAARPPASRRVSMPPQIGGGIGGPRPRPERHATALPLASVQHLVSSTAPGAPASTTSSRQSSSILSPFSPTSTSSATTSHTETGTNLAPHGALRGRKLSFGRDMLGSFPWGQTSALGDGGDNEGVGVLHPSPRRVPSLSPELRGMMMG